MHNRHLCSLLDDQMDGDRRGCDLSGVDGHRLAVNPRFNGANGSGMQPLARK
jgi:hypothetical protein